MDISYNKDNFLINSYFKKNSILNFNFYSFNYLVVTNEFKIRSFFSKLWKNLIIQRTDNWVNFQNNFQIAKLKEII
jgi:hypothetical protein